MPMTNYMAQQVVNHFFRNAAVSSPAAVYVSLHITPTDSAGGGTELTGGSYARAQGTFAAPSANGMTSNATTLDYEDLPAGEVTHVAAWDALVGGNMLMFQALVDPELLTAGQSLSAFPGDFVIDLNAPVIAA